MAATSAQFAQYALNIAIPLQLQFRNGQAEPATKGDYITILAAIACLAESLLLINNATSGGGTVPNSLVSGKWSAQQPITSPIQT